MKILITCFGAFHNFSENPSQIIMDRIKQLSENLKEANIEWEELEVKFRCVDKFINKLDHSNDLIIHLGVATGAPKLRFEMRACNLKDGTDNDGLSFDNLPIEPGISSLLTSFPVDFINKFASANEHHVHISNDAGAYLCNYVYFKSLAQYKEKSNIIFIHLADFQNNELASSSEEQALIVFDFLKEYINYSKQLNIFP